MQDCHRSRNRASTGGEELGGGGGGGGGVWGSEGGGGVRSAIDASKPFKRNKGKKTISACWRKKEATCRSRRRGQGKEKPKNRAKGEGNHQAVPCTPRAAQGDGEGVNLCNARMGFQGTEGGSERGKSELI